MQKKIVEFEDRLERISGVKDEEGNDMTEVMIFDPVSKIFITSYKEPQEHNYTIFGDMVGVEGAFKFFREYTEGSNKPFPNLPPARPSIPSPYYEKRGDYFVIESYFATRNYKIIAPSIGSMMREDSIYVRPEDIKDVEGEKYFTRCYDTKYDTLKCTVVGLDFNPYSPYASSTLEMVQKVDYGVKYVRRYKDQLYPGAIS